MKRSGQADLPLHYGKVPPWLYERMSKLGGAIIEAIVAEYGKQEVLARLSDPLWFQSLGAVLGMDWHSSGITTSVMGALKKAVNPVSKELGIYFCGGRGKHSRQTPVELLAIADKTGVDGNELVTASRLSAKIDNTAIQDGFQIYLHTFVLTDTGTWAVIQQGMNEGARMARRYHWHSAHVRSFVEEPHTSVIGVNQGQILNLTHKLALDTKKGILALTNEDPGKMLREVKHIKLPSHHDVQLNDVDIKRLGTILALANNSDLRNFESLLLLNGLGPKTLRSLTMVSEVIHGTPSRFEDPARFSFAHGGKDRQPYAVETKVYDKTICVMENALRKAKIGQNDKQKAIKRLGKVSQEMEQHFTPNPANYDQFVEHEKQNAYKYGGRTVFGKEKPPVQKKDTPRQLRLPW
jgi:hypothetical protein